MWLFISPQFIRDINYIECTVEFNIKGDNSVIDPKIQQKPLYFQCELSPKSRQIEMNDYTFNHIDI